MNDSLVVCRRSYVVGRYCLRFGRNSGKLGSAACAKGGRPLGRGPERFYAGMLRSSGFGRDRHQRTEYRTNDLLGRGILRALEVVDPRGSSNRITPAERNTHSIFDELMSELRMLQSGGPREEHHCQTRIDAWNIGDGSYGRRRRPQSRLASSPGHPSSFLYPRNP